MSNTTNITDPHISTSFGAREQGRLISGRYEIIELKGKGGMGAVYRAIDRQLNRMVALKRILTASHMSVSEVALREARTLAALSHPNIIGIYDIVQDQDEDRRECLWMVTAWLEGRSLRELDHPIHPIAVLGIMVQVLSALAASHKLKVFHRDINPSNIMLTGDGKIILIDFGVASSPGISTGETIAGTLKYIDHRILEGKPADALSDLFSTSIMLLELLSGKTVLPDLAPLPLYNFLKSGLLKKIDEISEGTYPPLTALARRYLDDRERSSLFSLGERVTEEVHVTLREKLQTLTTKSPEECVAEYMTPGTCQDVNIQVALLKESREALEHPSLSPKQKAHWISFRATWLETGIEETIDKSHVPQSIVDTAILKDKKRSMRRSLTWAITGASLVAVIGTGAFLLKKQPVNEPPKSTVTVQTSQSSDSTSPATKPLIQSLALHEPSKNIAKESLVLITSNVWADLYVDQIFVGRLPRAKPFPIKLGKHTFRLENSYMETLEKSLVVNDEPQAKLKFELTPKSATHRFVLNEPGLLYIDDIEYGFTNSKELKLPFGTHHIKVMKNGVVIAETQTFIGPDTPKDVLIE